METKKIEESFKLEGKIKILIETSELLNNKQENIQAFYNPVQVHILKIANIDQRFSIVI
jgi:hypothetical protein